MKVEMSRAEKSATIKALALVLAVIGSVAYAGTDDVVCMAIGFFGIIASAVFVALAQYLYEDD